jgi:hypothetical protein
VGGGGNPVGNRDKIVSPVLRYLNKQKTADNTQHTTDISQQTIDDRRQSTDDRRLTTDARKHRIENDWCVLLAFDCLEEESLRKSKQVLGPSPNGQSQTHIKQKRLSAKKSSDHQN